MDAGLYANIFSAAFPDEPVIFMCAERNTHPDLDRLREELTEKSLRCRVFADGNLIYGYGSDQSTLDEFSFSPSMIRICGIPALASRLLVEGFVDALKAAGCTCYWRFGRATIYRFSKPIFSSPKGINLFRGFEVQSLYLFDPDTEDLVYNLVVNVEFAYRDTNDQPVSPHDIVTRYGNDTLAQIRIKQGDLVPNQRINLEISHQRLVDTTLPFIRKFADFSLPCGIMVKLSAEPTRIVLSSEAETR